MASKKLTVSLPLSRAQLVSVHKNLFAWFEQSARVLPWRGTRDLYAIWVSEIMLQQTQVATVIDYYRRFLGRFPTVRDLAEASETDVLSLWEGLGYYRRARQLHAAAHAIMERHTGEFPETFDEVLALPGIGRYTAGAILSIGRNAQLPILEANTIRVLSRLVGYRESVVTTAGQKYLWTCSEQLLPSERTGTFNQALMELGALICTPREPKCDVCPIRASCVARQLGLQESIPLAKQKQQFEDVHHIATVVRRSDGAILMRQHPTEERWAGLWDFPRWEWLAGPMPSDVVALHTCLADQFQSYSNQRVSDWRSLTVIKHGVTRFRITLHVYECSLTSTRPRACPTSAAWQWIAISELVKLPLNTTGRRIAKMLSTTH